ncbi:MAG TPA: hypothetical protein VKT78_19780 [Fimbriimonadaceae bacterium]|nr:hypothetical protein [Fimbriimonadaceae bacterium]
MIEVIFVVHARGKVTTGAGTVEALPEPGQLIQIRGADHRVLGVITTIYDGTVRLPKPEIDVEPVPDNRPES